MLLFLANVIYYCQFLKRQIYKKSDLPPSDDFLTQCIYILYLHEDINACDTWM